MKPVHENLKGSIRRETRNVAGAGYLVFDKLIARIWQQISTEVINVNVRSNFHKYNVYILPNI